MLQDPSVPGSVEALEHTEHVLQALGTVLRYEKGDYLFREGEAPDHIYIIRHGLIKVSQITDGGQSVTFFLRRDGQSMGLCESVLGRVRLRYARCLIDSEVLVLKSADLLEHFHDPGFLHGLLIRLSRNFLQMQHNFAELTTKSATVRLVSLLVSFAKEDGHGRWLVELPISHEEISQLVGCSRQKTTQYLSAWKNQGLLTYTREKMVIHDLSAFAGLCRD